MIPTRSAGHALGWRAMQLAGGQLISLVRMVVLARIVAPGAFGLVAVATATIAVLMGLSNLGMREALVQRPAPTDDEYDVGWTVGVVRAATVTGLLVVFAPLAAAMFGEPNAASIVRMMALRPLIDASASVGVTKLTRSLAFRPLAFMVLPASVVDAVVAITLAPTVGAWALVAGTLSGAVVQLVLSYILAPHRPRLMFDRAIASTLVRFGRWILFTGVLALVGSSLTQMGISRMLGAAALGTYVVAARLAFLPSEAASMVVGSVAFPLYAAARDDVERVSAAFGRFLTGQVLLLFPISAIIIALAPTFEAALGGRWAGTASVTQVLTVACTIGLFGDAVVPLLQGQGRTDRIFRLEVLQTGLLLVLLIPFLRMFGVVGAALAWLVGNLASQFMVVVYSRDVLRRSLDAMVRRRLMAALVATAVACAVAWAGAAALRAAMSAMWVLLVTTAAAAAAAALILWIADRAGRLRLHEFLPWDPAWQTLAAPSPSPDLAER